VFEVLVLASAVLRVLGRRPLRSATCPNWGEIYEFDPYSERGEKTTAQRIWFPQPMWSRIVARAKVTADIRSATELVRAACAEMLAMPPRLHNLLEV